MDCIFGIKFDWTHKIISTLFVNIVKYILSNTNRLVELPGQWINIVSFKNICWIHLEYAISYLMKCWIVAISNTPVWWRWCGCQYVSRHCNNKSFHAKNFWLEYIFCANKYPSGLLRFNLICCDMSFASQKITIKNNYSENS